MAAGHTLIQHLLARASLDVRAVRVVGGASRASTVHFVDLGLGALDRGVADGRVHARVLQVGLLARDRYLLEGLVAGVLVVHQLDASERLREPSGRETCRGLQAGDVRCPVLHGEALRRRLRMVPLVPIDGLVLEGL